MSKFVMTLVGITFSLLLSAAAAQEVAVDSNAALKYWQAFAVMPQLDEQEARHFGGTPGGGYPPNYFGAPLNDIAVGLIRRSETALKLLHRGAEYQDCAWGVDLDDGPNALLPHMSKARHLAGLACLRARYHFEHEQHDAGVDDVLAALTLGRHVGSDRTLIGLYVQRANEKQAIAIAAAYVTKLPKATLLRLATKLNALPPGGSLKGSLKVEEEHMLGWFIKQLQSEQRTIEEIFGPDAQTLATVAATDASSDQMAEMLEAVRPYYDQLAQIIELHPEERSAHLASIQQNAQQASPLAKLFIPGYRIAFENEAQAQTRMAMFKAAVDVAFGGPDRVTAHSDLFGGPFEYRLIEEGPAFELSSELKVKNKPFAMTFGGELPTFAW